MTFIQIMFATNSILFSPFNEANIISTIDMQLPNGVLFKMLFTTPLSILAEVAYDYVF